MEEIKGRGYEITPATAMFLGRTAHKQSDGTWKFDEHTAGRIDLKTPEEVYADFQKNMASHIECKESYSKIGLLHISPCHAIALYAYGIITDEMFDRIEEGDRRAYSVIGNDNGTPIVEEIPASEELSCLYFAKQDITFDNETFQAAIAVSSSPMELHMHIAATD